MIEIPGYELLHALHEGTRSRVWRARRRRDGAAVVVKLPAAEHLTADEAARFRREYEVGQILEGDGGAAVLGFEPVRDRWTIVMEDIGGEALRVAPGAPRGVREVLGLGVRLAGALAAIHRRRIVHKDVSPQNIVQNPRTGRLQMIDFGLSAVLPRGSAGLRSARLLEGTLRYIAPEQTGRMNRAVDQRSDLYSAGVVLYELLTGRAPFVTDDVLALVHMHLAERPVPPRERRAEVPEPLSDVIMKLLAKDPEERYQSAEGLAADLEACLELHGAEGAPRAFAVGQRDAPPALRISQRLYGRDAEVERLLAAFARASRGRAELLLVGGDAGVGKTTLVAEIHRPVIAARGYHVSGKFDQLRRDVPYAPLVQAFSELVRQLLTEPAARLVAWRAGLLAALGQSAPVLVDAIPLVARILGEQPPPPPLPPGEAQHRHSLAFQRFVQVVASAAHPLVLFLDDLQWADLPSLQLVEQLVGDPEIRHLLVVGAYRGGEVSPSHPLTLTTEALEASGARVTRLALSSLGFEHVARLLEDALRAPPERVEPLARLLFERTGGNPFFLGQLLAQLEQDGLIEREPGARAFRWDMDAVRARGITDDVVAFMADKIRKLPAPACAALVRAACVGNLFELGTLAIAEQRSPEEAAASLREALDEGLLLALDGGGLRADVRPGMRFRFLHDRVQQAAYSLIPEGERAALHLSIGRLLLRATPPEALEARLFDVVNQLDLGLSLVEGDEERYQVARLNLAAGRKAKASAAHEPALHYLTAGLSLLPPRAWEDEGELAFALHCEAMEAEYLNAHVERAEALSERLLARATRVLDRVKVYETRISFNTTKSEIRTAIENGYQAMALLGVELPREMDQPTFLAILAETRRVIGDRGADDLVALPAMTAPEWLAVTRIAALLITPVYFVDALLSFSIVLRVLALTLPHGRAPESAFLFAEYALIHAAILVDFDTSEAYGRLARTLADRDAREGMRARVYTMNALFLVHCKAHLSEGLPLSVEAVRAGLESGDLEYMGYGAVNHAIAVLLSGEQLDVCIREHTRYLDLVHRYRLGVVAVWIETVQQTALSFVGGAAAPGHLAGEVLDEDRLLSTLVATANITGLSLFYICKTMRAVFFRDTDRALAAAEAAEGHVQAQAGQFSVVSLCFFQALALLSRAGATADPEERARCVEKATANLAKLRMWAAAAPMNTLHKARLVEAELARVRGDDLAALRLYAEAIQGAVEHRWTHEEALAHELEGELFLARGLERQARKSLVEARHAYQRWGASAKVEDLERRYPGFFPRGAARAAELTVVSTSRSEAGVMLDLAAVLRAAQAISGEIILDRLLDKLMAITIENAGAQRGLFILPRGEDGSLEITGERTAAGEGGVRAPVLVDGDAPASSAIIHYVARTGESVVLADAAAEGRFTADAYVARRRSRSILCAPLVNQGRLVAIVYLENDLAAGAFTEDRLEVLRLLSAQAALSIHNAVLYARLEEHSRTLEQKVEARTRELQDKNGELGRALAQLESTKEQLVVREKLASLGALTAGIAHELKNPLNFVNNFAQSSAELAREMAEVVSGQRARLDDDVAADLDELSTSLQQSTAKIEEHGRRAAQIIDGMGRHARASSGDRAPADLNVLVAESVTLAVEAARSRDPGQSVVVDARYDPAIGSVELVSPEIGRVILSVVDNSCHAVRARRLRAGPAYAPTIEVRTASLGDRAEVRIRDNGAGIPASILGRIFDPFFTTRPAGEGTGLGLSIAHDIVVRGHQGELRAASAEGDHTEIVIVLPVSASPALSTPRPGLTSAKAIG
jgi:predicted ATPase/signal transduction histidine kinase